ncbi:tyrosine-protein phosphatase [Epilithonimonas pallida]|uniref:Protein-tyrosine phosphatase n=1 Tax=Epilithonimonas pallida TaxID=373671 RepID=A0ABY1R6A9_9FLAO|nr:tyrosine-protein phosphatase [Epilithonimonas pallida]SMP97071.1 protein-tyrosine phosphatase [Epilithonimonas pallida]
MRHFYYLIFLFFISCKTYTSSKTEFSTYSNQNHIGIKKVYNLRYLGGIKNSEGKILKDSLIYRSGNLHNLRKSSFDELTRMKINKVIDLRTKQEIAKEPDQLPKNMIYKVYSAFEDKNDEMRNAKQLALKGKISENDADKRMIKFYTDCVSENPEIIKKIITEILNSDQPILYHCTAGKDRTGIITALILKVLKFDDAVIFEEYLQSNNLRSKIIQKRLNLADNFHFIFPKLDMGVIEKTSWVEQNYLQLAFDEIDKQYGSIDNYIHQVLGISDEQREIYIQKFLQ